MKKIKRSRRRKKEDRKKQRERSSDVQGRRHAMRCGIGTNQAERIAGVAGRDHRTGETHMNGTGAIIVVAVNDVVHPHRLV